MLSNAYFLAKFRFDTAENEPAKNLQIVANFANLDLVRNRGVLPARAHDEGEAGPDRGLRLVGPGPRPAGLPLLDRDLRRMVLRHGARPLAPLSVLPRKYVFFSDPTAVRYQFSCIVQHSQKNIELVDTTLKT